MQFNILNRLRVSNECDRHSNGRTDRVQRTEPPLAIAPCKAKNALSASLTVSID